jgi:DoxX-like family
MRMFRAYVIVTVVTAAANVYAAITDFLRPKWVLNNMAEVHVPRRWLPLLAILKGAGASGLLLGLVGFRTTGRAASSGLVLFFIEAIATHMRARAFHNIAFPGAYLALATASLMLAMQHHRGNVNSIPTMGKRIPHTSPSVRQRELLTRPT